MSERSPSDEEPVERADGGFVDDAVVRDDRLLGEQTAITDETDSDDARVCWLDDENADEVIGALASETARSIVTTLQAEPHTASELADAVETTVQNVRHHLEKLQSAGLVTDAGTRYSVKGREMTVYTASSDRVVVAVGSESESGSFLESLRGLLGAIGLLGVASAAVQRTVTFSPELTRATDSVAATTPTAVPPGVVFFVGGLALLTVLALAARR